MWQESTTATIATLLEPLELDQDSYFPVPSLECLVEPGYTADLLDYWSAKDSKNRFKKDTNWRVSFCTTESNSCFDRLSGTVFHTLILNASQHSPEELLAKFAWLVKQRYRNLLEVVIAPAHNQKGKLRTAMGKEIVYKTALELAQLLEEKNPESESLKALVKEFNLVTMRAHLTGYITNIFPEQVAVEEAQQDFYDEMCLLEEECLQKPLNTVNIPTYLVGIYTHEVWYEIAHSPVKNRFLDYFIKIYVQNSGNPEIVNRARLYIAACVALGCVPYRGHKFTETFISTLKAKRDVELMQLLPIQPLRV